MIVQTAEGKELYGDTDENLVRAGYLRALSWAHTKDEYRTTQIAEGFPGFIVQSQMPVPPGRGFGSSAVAYAAGVAAAQHVLADHKMPANVELRLLSALEGHPDNICAAWLGGWNFFHTAASGDIQAVRRAVPRDLGLILLYPDFAISTTQSRRGLPESYAMRDVLSNLRGVLLWLEFLNTGDFSMLEEALTSDRLHEPHRIPGIHGFDDLKQLILAAGATGVCLSGSGPGMAAFFQKSSGAGEKIIHSLGTESHLTRNWVFEMSEVDEKGLLIESK
jgi:homoserine kinase